MQVLISCEILLAGILLKLLCSAIHKPLRQFLFVFFYLVFVFFFFSQDSNTTSEAQLRFNFGRGPSMVITFRKWF